MSRGPVLVFSIILLAILCSGRRIAAESESNSLIPDHENKYPAVVLPHGARVSEKVLSIPGLVNVGRVTPTIYRGAQPTPEGFRILKKMGFRTILNLRHTTSEKGIVEALGMKSIEIPMAMLSLMDRSKVDKAVEVLADPANQPVYVHCKVGQDRTGIVVAAYRMKVQGWTLAVAESELPVYGFNPLWYHLKWFLRAYAASIRKMEL